MYQFVLSHGVMPPFSLSVCHPLALLPLDTMSHASVCDFENTLVMVRPSGGTDSFVEMLTDSKVILLCNCHVQSVGTCMCMISYCGIFSRFKISRHVQKQDFHDKKFACSIILVCVPTLKFLNDCMLFSLAKFTALLARHTDMVVPHLFTIS